MPGKGPLPKVAGKRQRRNKRTMVQIVPHKIDAPRPPRRFLKQTRDAWDSYWRSDVAQIVNQDTDAQAVQRFFSLLDLRERTYRSYRDEPFLVGSQGQQVINPEGALLLRMDAEIRMLGQELGMSPAARLRLGVQLGQAQEQIERRNRTWQNDADEEENEADPREIHAI